MGIVVHYSYKCSNIKYQCYLYKHTKFLFCFRSTTYKFLCSQGYANFDLYYLSCSVVALTGAPAFTCISLYSSSGFDNATMTPSGRTAASPSCMILTTVLITMFDTKCLVVRNANTVGGDSSGATFWRLRKIHLSQLWLTCHSTTEKCMLLRQNQLHLLSLFSCNHRTHQYVNCGIRSCFHEMWHVNRVRFTNTTKIQSMHTKNIIPVWGGGVKEGFGITRERNSSNRNYKAKMQDNYFPLH